MALQPPSGIVLRVEGLARNIHRNCAAVYKSIHSVHRPLNNGVCPLPRRARGKAMSPFPIPFSPFPFPLS